MANCISCQAFYIGLTKRRLKERIYNHVYDIRKHNELNALAKHINLNPTHQFRFRVLQVLEVGPRMGDNNNALAKLELEWIFRSVGNSSRAAVNVGRRQTVFEILSFRQIQNVLTGIDVTVPEYQEIRGKMLSGHVEYQLVVVTRLSSFKSAKHKPEDVVQFAISKMYSELDEFYQALTAQYPGAELPPMPRKALFVGEADIRERRGAFDEIMRFISKDSSLSTCPEFLEFLGAKSSHVADVVSNYEEEKEVKESEAFDFFSEKETSGDIPHFISAKNKKVHTAPKTREKEEEEEEEEEALDPLGIMRCKKSKKPAAPAKDVPPKFSLFEEVDPDEELFHPGTDSSDASSKKQPTKDRLKLFEDPDLGGAVKLGDSLLLASAYSSKTNVPATSLEEDTEDLFRVEDDFEKLLKLGSSAKPKPKLPPKPLLPKKPAEVSKRSTTVSAVDTPKQNVEAMNEMDILTYIQQNESTTSNSLDLFS
ncbi:HCLS1-binding protein 3 [Protopterus annectens]|uniref:HCLS1-binding protein 3 n=1 Tax=Protopterus annectens TaxID=7888 RepID=UPI001CF94E91|nr:HCLS1-binding protein 3 [Protopterus annectens]